MDKLFVPLIIILIIQTTIQAQDYFPLQTGNSWIYAAYDGDPVNPMDTATLEIIDEFIINGLGVYDFGSDLYLIEDPEEPNNIYTAYSEEDIISGDYELIFKHAYMDNDTFITGDGPMLSTYIGNYTTNLGQTYDSCFALTSLDYGHRYVFSADIGLVAALEGEYDNNEYIELISYSIEDPTSTINNQAPEANFQIYPNPTNGLIFIDSKVKPQDIRVYDLTGKKVLSGYTDISLDLSHLKAGVYFLQIEFREGVEMIKFIKK